MRNRVTKHPTQCSWKLPIWATQGLDSNSGVGMGEVDPDFDAKDSMIMDSLGPTKLCKKKKKKDVFEDSDSVVDEVVYKGTKVKSLLKKIPLCHYL